uniref:Uncharacterized protein n=1 Tax=Neisseria meningitidis alpha522 TaxID=996307 RepID=I4E6Z9_NEIME|nr:hypothetical protein NMALPHA522_1576 [Neisseria meningitidis alpha522]
MQEVCAFLYATLWQDLGMSSEKPWEFIYNAVF